MFGLFKKEVIDSTQRLALIEMQLLKRFAIVSKEVLLDLQHCDKGFDMRDRELHSALVSTILTLQFGFGVLALNIGIRTQQNYRELVYDTFSEWENKIRNNSIQFSRNLESKIQKDICQKFEAINFELRPYLHNTNNSFQNMKAANDYFENCFVEIAKWYADHYNLGASQRFIECTRNHFLSSFALLGRLFAKYKHV